MKRTPTPTPTPNHIEAISPRRQHGRNARKSRTLKPEDLADLSRYQERPWPVLEALMFLYSLTDSTLGERLGLSRNTIRAWRTGISSPSWSRLKHLCDLFGMDEATLRRGSFIDLYQPKTSSQK